MSKLSAAFGFDAADASQKAAKSQGNRNAAVAKSTLPLFQNAASAYGDWQNVLGSMHADGSLGAALNYLNQNPDVAVSHFGAGANEHAANAASQYGNYLKSQGYGDGAQAGAAAGLFGDAAKQTNAYAAQQYSPEARLSALQSYLQAVSAGNAAYANPLSSLSGVIYGQPQVQQVQSPLAGLLGQAAGIFASGATGGASNLLPMGTSGMYGINSPTSSTPFYS